MKIFFTADTHFGHSNIIKYCARPFANVQDMNRALIANWNSVVSPLDTIYHLGDFAMGPAALARGYLSRLNGRKILIRGNHDRSAAKMSEIGFDEVHQSMVYGFENHLFYMSHKPNPEAEFPNRFSLCGHVHTAWLRLNNTINVGVDVWDYKPVALATLLNMPLFNSEVAQLLEEGEHVRRLIEKRVAPMKDISPEDLKRRCT